jgi:hypothetical protein
MVNHVDAEEADFGRSAATRRGRDRKRPRRTGYLDEPAVRRSLDVEFPGWAPLPRPNIPLTRPRLVSEEGDVTAGALKTNDAYDLKLWEMPDGSYELVLFMKLQFFFEDGEGGAAGKWTDADKKKFMQDWTLAVKVAWSGRGIKVLKSGKRVSVRLDFAVQQGGWMMDHWEITVTKIAPGTFRRSYVNVKTGNVELDSEDLTGVPKGGGQMQRGAVHEFGHMLGLDDEYPPGAPSQVISPPS